MKVTNISIQKGDKYIQYSADFIFSRPFLRSRKEKAIYYIKKLFEKHPLIVKRRVWFKAPIKYCNQAEPDNSFFILAVPLAIAANEDLYFDGIVSTKLYNNMDRLPEYIGFKGRKIKIAVKKTNRNKITGKNIGQFFTMGVDSFYTLLFNKKEKPKFLIYVRGCDFLLKSTKVSRQIRINLKQVTEKFNIEVILVDTNIRSISDKILSWDLYYGAVLASFGLFLSGFFKKIYLSVAAEYMKPMLWGTGPEIDKLWATEQVQLYPFGANFRFNKIKKLSSSSDLPFILKKLQVCWSKRDSYNCSQCEKCIRTHLSFISCGIKIPTETFNKIKSSSLKKISIHPVNLTTWKKIYNALKNSRMIDSNKVKIIKDLISH